MNGEEAAEMLSRPQSSCPESLWVCPELPKAGTGGFWKHRSRALLSFVPHIFTSTGVGRHLEQGSTVSLPHRYTPLIRSTPLPTVNNRPMQSG